MRPRGKKNGDPAQRQSSSEWARALAAWSAATAVAVTCKIFAKPWSVDNGTWSVRIPTYHCRRQLDFQVGRLANYNQQHDRLTARNARLLWDHSVSGCTGGHEKEDKETDDSHELRTRHELAGFPPSIWRRRDDSYTGLNYSEANESRLLKSKWHAWTDWQGGMFALFARRDERRVNADKEKLLWLASKATAKRRWKKMRDVMLTDENWWLSFVSVY